MLKGLSLVRIWKRTCVTRSRTNNSNSKSIRTARMIPPLEGSPPSPAAPLPAAEDRAGFSEEVLPVPIVRWTM